MKVRYILMTAAATLALQGCSDWDDHYADNGNGIAGSDATLWEQIKSNEELSNFATLLQKVGYDQALNTNQSYTVWAPNNNAYNFEKYNVMSDSLLKAEFLNNHIARGYHRASGEVSERIHLLNKKVMELKGNENYTVGGFAIKTPNILGKNGIMHLMNEAMAFRPNFYEYFNRDHEDGSTTNNLGEIFTKNMQREIDKDKSVEGPMHNGELTYLDTVYVESNKMFNTLNAKLTDEDSTYTMIIPNDKAWEKAYKHVEQYFNYPTSVQPFTLSNNEKTGVLEYAISSAVDVPADSLRNKYTTESILEPLIYSNTINPALKDDKLPQNAKDSIESTTGHVICNTLNYQSDNATTFNDAIDIFTGTTKQAMSNGTAYLTGDSLYMKPWTSWCTVRRLRAQNGSYQAGIDNITLAQNVTLDASERNPAVSGSMHTTAFYQVSSKINSQPQVYLYAPTVQSTAYAVYLTMVPANITDTTAVPQTQKIQIRALSHAATGKAPAAASGKIPSFQVLKKDFQHMGTSDNMAATTFNYGTKNDSRILTKYMGIYKPNICYQNIGGSEAIRPIFNVNCTTRTAGGSTVLRIAGITLVPQEAVEYYLKEGVIDDYKDEMPEVFWNLNYTY